MRRKGELLLEDNYRFGEKKKLWRDLGLTEIGNEDIYMHTHAYKVTVYVLVWLIFFGF